MAFVSINKNGQLMGINLKNEVFVKEGLTLGEWNKFDGSLINGQITNRYIIGTDKDSKLFVKEI